jgi:hypothetical protein
MNPKHEQYKAKFHHHGWWLLAITIAGFLSTFFIWPMSRWLNDFFHLILTLEMVGVIVSHNNLFTWNKAFNRWIQSGTLACMKMMIRRQEGLKSFEEWAEELEPMTKKLFLENLEKDKQDEIVCCLSEAIRYGFLWKNSKQGKDFWRDLYYSIRDKETSASKEIPETQEKADETLCTTHGILIEAGKECPKCRTNRYSREYRARQKELKKIMTTTGKKKK